MLSNTNNSIQYYSFVYKQLNGFKCSKWLNSSIWTIDGTPISTTTSGQSGPGAKGNKGVFYIPQNSRTGTSPSDGLVSHLGHSLGERVSYPSSVIQSAYSLSWQSKRRNNNNNNNNNNTDHWILTRPHVNYQEEKNLLCHGFCILMDHRMKIKESKNIDNYIDLARELEKQEHESYSDTNCS